MPSYEVTSLSLPQVCPFVRFVAMALLTLIVISVFPRKNKEKKKKKKSNQRAIVWVRFVFVRGGIEVEGEMRR